MSAAEKTAVFLSYASQDAEAARRICEALRAGDSAAARANNEKAIEIDPENAAAKRALAELSSAK